MYATLLNNAMGLALRFKVGRYQATMQMNIHYVASVSEGTIRGDNRIYVREGMFHIFRGNFPAVMWKVVEKIDRLENGV